MATSVPIGNPAGFNQANPAIQGTVLSGSATPMGATPSSPAAPIPGGSTPSSLNPYIVGGGMPGTTSGGTVPSGSPALPANFSYSQPGVLPGMDPGQAALLSKQFVDIAGKGVGGQLAQQYAGMAGTDSAIFQQWMAGQAPVWAQQTANFQQGMGAAGVGANSTVEALGLSNLEAQQAAQAGSMNAQLMQQNQQNQLGILQQMEKPAEQEVASSGWDVFGQVVGDVGQLAGAATGMGGLSSLTSMFGGGGTATPAFLSTPAVQQGLGESIPSGLPTEISA